MQPVVDLKARIVQIRTIERGETVGYGGTWSARRPTKLAIVAVGYADGYFRAASSNDGTRGAEVIVAGKRCPVAGRVSMDLIAIDITDLPPNTVRRGHMVTLLGEGITVDEARASFRHHRIRGADEPRPSLCPGLQGRQCASAGRTAGSRAGRRDVRRRTARAPTADGAAGEPAAAANLVNTLVPRTQRSAPPFAA